MQFFEVEGFFYLYFYLVLRLLNYFEDVCGLRVFVYLIDDQVQWFFVTDCDIIVFFVCAVLV